MVTTQDETSEPSNLPKAETNKPSTVVSHVSHLKRVDTDRPIVFEQELDRRTFETVSIHYVINENIFRFFVTIFFINFFFNARLHFDFTLTSF